LVRGELDALEHVMGERADACPWWAFHDPNVIQVLQAHDWFPNCSEWWGPDPEWWIVAGVRHFHRALDRARADAIKTESVNKRPNARLPPGAEVMHEIRG
jgi:hypothetical protein